MRNVLNALFVCIGLTVIDAYCPIVICPGFGNDSIDYDTPLEQAQEVGFKSVLARRGFDPDRIYTVPIKRSDWIRVAGGLLDIPNFYTGNALPSGPGYGWYLERLKETVDAAHEESGGEKVILMAHSAGGWLARAALGDGTWCDERGIMTNERIRGLVTMGAIHKVPDDEASCVTRGALKNTDLRYPGAFLKDEGIQYFSVGGAAILGEMVDKEDQNFRARASRVAYNSYVAVSGKGDQVGDGVVPFAWTQLDGANQIRLDGVVHSINEAGTTLPTDRWYGSEGVIDQWLPIVLKDLQLGNSISASGGNGALELAGIKKWVTKMMNPTPEVSR